MGTRERKERELAERKQLIIDKSKELFFEHGFNNVSVSDICKAVEYGQSAIYSIFSSKEEIYGYIYVEAMVILANHINTIDIESVDLKHPLRDFTIQIFNFYENFNPYYTALFFLDSNHVALSKIPLYLIEQKYKEKERAMIPVRKVINSGIVNNILRVMDVDRVIFTYFSAILGIINTFLIENMEPDNKELRGIIFEFAEIFEQGLRLGG